MADDIAFLKAENIRLHAETLAIQAILFELMVGLRTSGAVDRLYLESAFDNAANGCEALAIMLGKRAASEHTVGALRIVEQLRDQFVAAK
jgi:hypothetical protein